MQTGEHAFLHDFCMSIPYGCIVVLTGIAVAYMKPLAAGILLIASGLGVLVSSNISLKRWKQGKDTSVSTGVNLFIAGYHTWLWGACVIIFL